MGQKKQAGAEFKKKKKDFWAKNWKKNAAKRSRQHAGGKYREYAQHRVCFVNEQVP